MLCFFVMSAEQPKVPEQPSLTTEQEVAFGDLRLTVETTFLLFRDRMEEDGTERFRFQDRGLRKGQKDYSLFQPLTEGSPASPMVWEHFLNQDRQFVCYGFMPDGSVSRA